MFGGGRGGMYNDPFFNAMNSRMNQQMNQMDNLMNNMMFGGGGFNQDPFGMMMPPRMRIAAGPHPQQQQGAAARQQMMEEDLRGAGAGLMMSPFQGMFGGFGGGLFSGMQRQMEQAMNNPNAHVYSHSTVVSYDGQGEQPRVYESTNSTTKHGPVKETRRTVRDSGTGEERMSIGHHIHDRAHVIEKKRIRGGNLHEQQHFINMQNDDAPEFDREWRERTTGHGHGSHAHRPAIEAHTRAHPYRLLAVSVCSSPSRARQRQPAHSDPVPIVEEPEDEQTAGGNDDNSRRRTRIRRNRIVEI